MTAHNFIDITGQRFGRYTVVRRIEDQGALTRWLCHCDCGKEKAVLGIHLRKGRVVSCGCWAREKARARTKHGQSNNRTYLAYRSMLNRCMRPADKRYADYGGRGITVCERWKAGFESFFVDMGICPDGMQLDRIDNDGMYSPENCKWSTRKQQSNNKRSNVRYDYAGQSVTLKQLAELVSIDYRTLHWRLRVARWPLEKALSK